MQPPVVICLLCILTLSSVFCNVFCVLCILSLTSVFWNVYSVLCIVYSRVVIGVRSPYLYSTGFYCLFQLSTHHTTSHQLGQWLFSAYSTISSSWLRKNEDSEGFIRKVRLLSLTSEEFSYFPLRILNNRKKQLNAGNKWEIERCDFGMQNCQKVLESQNAQVRGGSI